MATYSLRLDRGGIRELHWHPNAAKFPLTRFGSSYRLSCKLLLTLNNVLT
jgi:hypothetical protein